MSKDYTRRITDAVERIIAQLPKRSPEALTRFTRQFYAKTPLGDTQHLPPEIAAQMAVSAFEFLQDRAGQKPKIRLLRPEYVNGLAKRRRVVLQILNDDMPFLFDSLSIALSRLDFDVYEGIHPILSLTRDAEGHLKEILEGESAKKTEGLRHESLIHLHISTPPAGMEDQALIEEIEAVLADVRAAITDFPRMAEKTRALRENVATAAKGFPEAEISETVDFLDWLMAKNFVFLGYLEVDFKETKKGRAAEPVGASRLGILKLDAGDQKTSGLAVLSGDPRHLTRDTGLIEINKTNTKSTVHRATYMEYIAVKRFGADGGVIGEARLIGLFTSLAYFQSAEQIPFIREKIDSLLAEAGYDPAGHNGKALRTILEFFPRDELFQIEDADLFAAALGILSLEARPGVGLFVRRDPFERYVSCLVYVPKEKFNGFVRDEAARLLAEAFDGSLSSFYTEMTNSPLARLHYIIKTPGGERAIDRAALEEKLSRLVNFWGDSLRDLLVERHGDREAERLYREYGAAFPQDYTNHYAPEAGLLDIAKMNEAVATGEAQFHLYAEAGAAPRLFRLKVYATDVEASLSGMLPTLENMGFAVIDVHPYIVNPKCGSSSCEVSIRDFVLEWKGELSGNFDAVRRLIEEALSQVWHNRMENDGFNALVAGAAIDWRGVIVLRAYGKYLKQVGLPYSIATIAKALGAHIDVAADLHAFFAARFDPKAKKTSTTAADAASRIAEALSGISNLTEDRIIRRYLATMEATRRTNFYQADADGAPKSYLSFKLDSLAVPEMPLPKPYAEIFVYSSRVEGIHLRGGKVARGGLRWSDRPEDFRTEILGLMKAQQVKNAVIVPVGSKGGFIVKNPPEGGGRDAYLAEGVACYKEFLHGLLDLTDNIKGGEIVPPADTVRLDGDDPYLVVAADKGTATFSDYANAVSAEYGFWLDDAFASGGSAGYDHKAMGITARGAWVGVMRHFRETGRDCQQEDFTCVGVGDMAGDVFGNGMLLSQHIRLLAAFNHLHIFLDPSPDAAKSFAERERLFQLPRSNWTDYNAALISKGGGVFERKAKSIALSKEAALALGTQPGNYSPDELIREILRAEVDLLWNGGIGTYVKAESQSNDEVGDRANDMLRINGADLRARIVGEGGNLGFTQKGRIEYAMAGGRINTDAIDNSAGVDTSDHEVNIKIGLQPLEASGTLTRKARDRFLGSLTDEVATLVLRDNRLQTQALSVAQLQGFDLFDAQVSLMQRLERKGLLDRAVEFLPTDKQIAAMRAENRGLTRPELAVLLAYAKMALYNELLASDIPDLPYFERDLLRYFPVAMAGKYGEALKEHRLKREIVATVLTNSMINRTGIAFLHGIAEDSGRDMAEIARAYVIARDAFGLRELWSAIEAGDGTLPPEAQVAMFAEINGFLEHMIFWLLIHGQHPLDIEKLTAEFTPQIAAYAKILPEITTKSLADHIDERTAHFASAGAESALAAKIAGLSALGSAADVASVSLKTGRGVAESGEVYFRLGERLGLDWLRDLATIAPTDSHWDRLAIKTLTSNLYATQRQLTLRVLESCKKQSDPAKMIEHFLDAHALAIGRYERLLRDLKATETRHIPMLVVALQQLGGL